MGMTFLENVPLLLIFFNIFVLIPTFLPSCITISIYILQTSKSAAAIEISKRKWAKLAFVNK